MSGEELNDLFSPAEKITLLEEEQSECAGQTCRDESIAEVD